MHQYACDHHPCNCFRSSQSKEPITNHPCKQSHDQYPFDAKPFKEPGHEQEKKHFRHLSESHFKSGSGNISRFKKDRHISKITCKGNADKQQAKYKNNEWSGSELFQHIEAKHIAESNFFTGAARRYVWQCKTVKHQYQTACASNIHGQCSGIAM